MRAGVVYMHATVLLFVTAASITLYLSSPPSALGERHSSTRSAFGASRSAHRALMLDIERHPRRPALACNVGHLMLPSSSPLCRAHYNSRSHPQLAVYHEATLLRRRDRRVVTGV